MLALIIGVVLLIIGGSVLIWHLTEGSWGLFKEAIQFTVGFIATVAGIILAVYGLGKVLEK